MSSHHETRIHDHHEVLKVLRGHINITRTEFANDGVLGLQLCIHGHANRLCNVLDFVNNEAIILCLGTLLGTHFAV